MVIIYLQIVFDMEGERKRERMQEEMLIIGVSRWGVCRCFLLYYSFIITLCLKFPK